MTAITFIMCLRHFSARRGVLISNNAKTFKSASKIVKQILNSPKVRTYLTQLNVKWKINLERALWWGVGGAYLNAW